MAIYIISALGADIFSCYCYLYFNIVSCAAGLRYDLVDFRTVVFVLHAESSSSYIVSVSNLSEIF